MKIDAAMDVLIVAVGVGLVVAGTKGVQPSVIWVSDPPGWQAYAGWILGAGFAVCLLGLILGLRGIGGFTALPATAGSFIGTLLAVVVAAKLLIRDVRLRHPLICEVEVASIEYAPQQNVRKPYQVTATVHRVLSGGASPEAMVFRLHDPAAESIHVGTGLRLEYRKPRGWMDLKTWFRRQVRGALEDVVSVSMSGK